MSGTVNLVNCQLAGKIMDLRREPTAAMFLNLYNV